MHKSEMYNVWVLENAHICVTCNPVHIYSISIMPASSLVPQFPVNSPQEATIFLMFSIINEFYML